MGAGRKREGEQRGRAERGVCLSDGTGSGIGGGSFTVGDGGGIGVSFGFGGGSRHGGSVCNED